MAALVVEIAPHVDLYIAKVSDAEEVMDMDQYGNESNGSRH